MKHLRLILLFVTWFLLVAVFGDLFLMHCMSSILH